MKKEQARQLRFVRRKATRGKAKQMGTPTKREPILLRGQSFQAVPIVSLICAAEVLLAKIRKGNGD